MAFLRINGITIPVLRDGASQKDEKLGEDDRTSGGSLVSELLAYKGGWPFSVQHTDRATAFKYRELIRGTGDFWPFTAAHDIYSSRGSAPVAVGGLVLGPLTGFNGHGTGKIAAGLGDATLPVERTNGTWTVGAFVNTSEFMFTEHHIMRSDGEYFINGVAQGSWITTWFDSLGDGTFNLKAHGGDNHFWTELFAVPFAIPNSWAPLIYANTGLGGWGNLPHVIASGDAVDDGIGGRTRIVRGSVEEQEILRGSVSGSQQPVHVLRAKLMEV